MLNEFVYCPRLFYLEFVEGVFVHNADTLRGAAEHKRVDSGKGALSPPTAEASNAPTPADAASAEPEVIHARSVWLASERLGVSAKMDLIEVHAAGGDLFSPRVVRPVEYKSGKPREGDAGIELWDADRIQLGLQALILRDQGYTCDEGVVYYRATRQRVTLAITAELEAWILDQIAAARAAAEGPLPPPLIDSPKCVRCSLAPVCLPDESRLLQSGSFEPDPDSAPTPEQVVLPFDADYPSTVSHPHDLADLAGSARTASRLRRPVEVRRLIAPRDEKRPLYVTTPGLFLARRDERLLLKDKGETVGEARVLELDHVAVFGPVQVSTAVVQILCEKDIPLTYFSTGGWFYGMTRGHGLKNVFTRIAQFEAAHDPAACLLLVRRMVAGKIRNQRTFLMRNHVEAPGGALVRLKELAATAENADNLGSLLGLEGLAALEYFRNFQGLLRAKDDNADCAGDIQAEFRFDFAKRTRRPPRDAVNALLSLAYSLLVKDATIAAAAVGFDPFVGFYHQPRFGRPALALDLMEEFRPLVADSAVVTAINTRAVQPGDFVRAGDAVNLTPAGRSKFLKVYERRLAQTIVHPVFDYKVTYRRALELQARILAKVLTGEIGRYTPFLTR